MRIEEIEELGPPSSRTTTPVVLSPSTPPPPLVRAGRVDASRADRAARRAGVVAAIATLALGALLFPRDPTMKGAPLGTLDENARASATLHGQFLGDVELLSVCPDEMALVEQGSVRVCVDKWEASVVEVMPSGGEVLFSPYAPLPPNRSLKAVSQPGAVPQGYASRTQASLACEHAGKRLCKGDEWVAACRGPEQTTYPYGNQEDPRACNTHGKNPVARLFGASKKNYSIGPMNHPWLNTLDGTVAKTGEFAACTNDYGVHDMVGNLHEWTADEGGTFRGGYYLDNKTNGKGCGYATTAHVGAYHDYSIGFRCCMDAP